MNPIKTDLTPIVQNLEHLTLTDLRVLIVIFHEGRYIRPSELQEKTGACRKSINKSLKSEKVRAIIQQMKQKSETARLILKLVHQVQQDEPETDSVF